jgi:tRNA (cmo5U34)-methyltransferase
VGVLTLHANETAIAGLHRCEQENRMNRDTLFERSDSQASAFEFNAQVAAVFDDMLARSIPFYSVQQEMLCELGAKFWIPGTRVYDLGCSTGTTLVNLSRILDGSALFVGYDNSAPMLAQARENIRTQGLEERIEVRHGDLNGPLDELEFEHTSLVTMCWTLQFIRPLQRDRLIRWIYDGLCEHGALLVTEKVLTNDSDMNRFFIELYYDFKRRNGYSENEILRKREALENVLIPYRMTENIELFRRNGFEIVEPFFQWYNFAGFLCIKNPRRSGVRGRASAG